MMSVASDKLGALRANALLGLMLLLAGCIGVGGALVARREVETRRERDRQAVRALSSGLQGEARKLEDLYEAHLKQIGASLIPLAAETEAARKAAQNIEGIARVSWLYWKSPTPESHLSVGLGGAAPGPEPTLEKEHPGLPRPRVLLDVKALFADPGGHSSGWIDEPGKPLMYHVQVLGQAVVLTIDRERVQDAMTGYLKAWLAHAFEPVKKLGGSDAVLDADGRTLIQTRAAPEREPDLLSPVVSRFAAWHVASWDERVIRIAYHGPTLAGSMALAVLVAGCGIGLSVQQRRAALLARQRVSFVNRVSHELRTPMTNILLNLDVIEDAVPEGVAARFALVREEAARLGRLIENVLTFSRQDEGRLVLQKVRCAPVAIVDGITRQFEPALQRRGIHVARVCLGGATETLLEADALAQIIANLLSNVEKYAPNAAVEIWSEAAAGRFVLRVSDGGQGIAARDAERIFEPFFRVDDRVEAGVSGTGLGLSIARELARRMGGDLRPLPTEHGACFELSIPAAPLPPP